MKLSEYLLKEDDVVFAREADKKQRWYITKKDRFSESYMMENLVLAKKEHFDDPSEWIIGPEDVGSEGYTFEDIKDHEGKVAAERKILASRIDELYEENGLKPFDLRDSYAFEFQNEELERKLLREAFEYSLWGDFERFYISEYGSASFRGMIRIGFDCPDFFTELPDEDLLKVFTYGDSTYYVTNKDVYVMNESVWDNKIETYFFVLEEASEVPEGADLSWGA